MATVALELRQLLLISILKLLDRRSLIVIEKIYNLVVEAEAGENGTRQVRLQLVERDRLDGVGCDTEHLFESGGRRLRVERRSHIPGKPIARHGRVGGSCLKDRYDEQANRQLDLIALQAEDTLTWKSDFRRHHTPPELAPDAAGQPWLGPT